MNLKKNLIFLLLAVIVSLSACNKQSDAVTRGEDSKTENINSGIVFPETYSISDDNVTFNLSPEIPENMDVNNLHEVSVRGILNNDASAALEYWGKDKDVVETHELPADQFTPEEYYYSFDDGSRLGAGGSSLAYASPHDQYYTRVFRQISDDAAILEDGSSDFSFASSSDCLRELADTLKMVGYDITFASSVFSLTAEQAKDWEEHLTMDAMDGDRQEDAYKNAWTEEDNAYLISAYQTYNGLPVFNEMLALNQAMAVDSPDNAPIQAICTARGLEFLTVMAQYEFIETDKVVSLLPFDTITKTISTKFNNILSESPYEVYKAKLFLMVRLVTAEDYEAFPVWYFEAREEGSDTKLVIIVDAATGKEINIGQ